MGFFGGVAGFLDFGDLVGDGGGEPVVGADVEAAEDGDGAGDAEAAEAEDGALGVGVFAFFGRAGVAEEGDHSGSERADDDGDDGRGRQADEDAYEKP